MAGRGGPWRNYGNQGQPRRNGALDLMYGANPLEGAASGAFAGIADRAVEDAQYGTLTAVPQMPRDKIAQFMLRDTKDEFTQRLVGALMGSRGFGHAETGLVDLSPLAPVFSGMEAQDKADRGDWAGAGLDALSMIPAGSVGKGTVPSFVGTRRVFGMPQGAKAGPPGESWAGIRAYHGTRSSRDFQTFRPGVNDLGIHFGSPRAATNRLYGRAALSANGSRIMPVDLNITNPLRLPDVRYWTSDNVARALKQSGFAPREVDRATSGLLERSRLEGLRKLIEGKGFDGIVYKNAYEGGGDSFVVFRPDQIRTGFGPWRNYGGTKDAVPVAPQPPGIRVYHGSPHDFDRFDLSKIGTGEGTQFQGQ